MFISYHTKIMMIQNLVSFNKRIKLRFIYFSCSGFLSYLWKPKLGPTFQDGSWSTAGIYGDCWYCRQRGLLNNCEKFRRCPNLISRLSFLSLKVSDNKDLYLVIIISPENRPLRWVSIPICMMKLKTFKGERKCLGLICKELYGFEE